MRPAARVGDSTAHGSPLAGAGSPNVLIGGRPAWRALADFAPCPQAVPGTPPVPHVGGVAVPGSATVLINKLPAARMGDTIPEAGPPNSIVSGEPTVLIK
ncbi:PAAR domain-containing protein [Natronobiforma cellulositropha]|uniref:PAAR domain-containing protein n=1 Tax=Natronobiforma cellulositropha TaxID=1679076 RepID=UPI0021D5F7A5|nr:PAAR domain-containing protein [Natronobiforma cellulositropha]